jgi:endonuclease III
MNKKNGSRDSEKNIVEIVEILKKKYPLAKCDLNTENAFNLLVSTILSAQATDKSVVKVTDNLFNKYRNAYDFSKLKPSVLGKKIKSIGLSKSKSKNIIKTASIIVQNYDGEVPCEMEKLIELPGVGRKTANVVLGNFFNIPSIAVDTHVKRISFRMGLTSYTDPNKIESDLQKIVPQNEWTVFAHLLIRLGREICLAKKAKCDECPVLEFCERRGVEEKS